MVRRSITAALALLILAGCATSHGIYKTGDDYDYQRFLAFSEGFVAAIILEGACDLIHASEIMQWLSERRKHVLVETANKNLRALTDELRKYMWLWLAQQRDRGEMTMLQYGYFSKALALW